MKIVNLSQRDKEWLEWRKKGVTASEASVLLGIWPLKTAYQLWQEKTGRREPDDLSKNPYVRRGVALEDKVRLLAEKYFEEQHGIQEFLLPICAESEDNQIMRCSFDGVRSNQEPVELKVPSEGKYLEVSTEREQSNSYKEYYPQVQHQMYVSGASQGWLFFYGEVDGKEEVTHFLIQRDDDMINDILSAAEKFMQCLLKDKPPELDVDRDIFVPDDLTSGLWLSYSDRYRSSHAEMTDLKKKMEEVKSKMSDQEKKLVALMGDFYHADFGGVKITRTLKQGSIDYKKAMEQHCPSVDSASLDGFRRAGTMVHRVTVSDDEMPRQIVDSDVKERIEKTKIGVEFDLIFA